mmetsp:Transcript_16450/g.14139  ORF Transcript_16450/g.14139 Transcript_16450/m.14139 type:complete len:83 (-) Transcript_16450:631-879(-)
MAEEGDNPYKLINNETGEELKHSWGFSGQGTATYPNLEMYEGGFEDGKRNGKGKYSYATGDAYEGEWKDNKKHGIGKLTYTK